MEKINYDQTIDEGRDYVNRHYRDKEGIICPCCDKLVRAYWRKLNWGMAYALILIYQKGDPNFIHVENYLKGLGHGVSVRGDFHKLRFWGFLKKKKGERDDGSPRNGHYKITKAGEDFVLRKIKGYKEIQVYADRPLAYSNEVISIDQALGKKFSYQELMNHG